MLKTVVGSVLALGLMASSASALVVTNKDKADHKIGIDMGHNERVETIAAGKTLDLSKDCVDGCGLTGPWGYSWMAKTGEDFAFDAEKGIMTSGS